MPGEPEPASPYDLLADDASWTIVGHSAASKTYPSKEAFLSEVIRPFNARMSVGLKPTIRNLYAGGDTVCSVREPSIRIWTHHFAKKSEEGL